MTAPDSATELVFEHRRPSATMGELDIYAKQVAENYDYFHTIEDAKTVVTCCPTCEYGLGTLGQCTTGRQHGKQMMDVVLFLAEVLQVKLDGRE